MAVTPRGGHTARSARQPGKAATPRPQAPRCHPPRRRPRGPRRLPRRRADRQGTVRDTDGAVRLRVRRRRSPSLAVHRGRDAARHPHRGPLRPPWHRGEPPRPGTGLLARGGGAPPHPPAPRGAAQRARRPRAVVRLRPGGCGRQAPQNPRRLALWLGLEPGGRGGQAPQNSRRLALWSGLEPRGCGGWQGADSAACALACPDPAFLSGYLAYLTPPVAGRQDIGVVVAAQNPDLWVML